MFWTLRGCKAAGVWPSPGRNRERERALAGKHNISEIRLARSANRFKPQTADAEFILMNFGDRGRRDPSIKWKKRRDRATHASNEEDARKEGSESLEVDCCC